VASRACAVNLEEQVRRFLKIAIPAQAGADRDESLSDAERDYLTGLH